MKKVAQAVVILCTIIMCICIFPAGLIRRETNVDPVLQATYGRTELGRELTQVFQAQTSYLSGIAFDIEFPDGTPDDGEVFFKLQRVDTGKIIAEETLLVSDINNGAFTYVSVDKWIAKGKVYSYSITASVGADVEFQAIHTLSDEEAVPGSQTLYFDGENVNGQAVTRYVYSFPLNYKNVICLWAFLLTICLILLELLSNKALFSESELISKAEKLLIRWQIPILLFEMLVIMLMIIRLCRNEVINWDEAFTWQIVTRNNLPGMIRATAADVHPPLYYMLVMIAINIFGEDIFVVKMVTVAAALATQILGITLVRKRWGVKAAIPFLLVAGIGPQMIYYNTDVRMYSWFYFFVVAAGLFAYEILQTKKLGWWIAFTLMSLAGAYTHYFAVIPLAFFYLSLLMWVLIWERKQIKIWIACSIATIVGYLPWLGVVINTVKEDAAIADKDPLNVIIGSFFTSFREWAFSNNITLSEYMPFVMFITVTVYFIVKLRKYTGKERAFIICAGLIPVLSFLVCMVLASVMNHFWSHRYLIGALIIFWLFMIVILADKNLLTWGSSVIWLGIFVLSSYTVMQADEFSAIPWMQEAKVLLEPVQEEEKIVYNAINDFYILYEYYLPDAEFVWYEDVNFDEMGNEFYMLSWGGVEFNYSLYETGYLTREVIGEFCIWEGHNVALLKIHINRKEET